MENVTVKTQNEARVAIKLRFKSILMNHVLPNSNFKHASLSIMPYPVMPFTDDILSISIYNLNKITDRFNTDSDIYVEICKVNTYGTKDEETKCSLSFYLEQDYRDNEQIADVTLQAAMEEFDECLDKIKFPEYDGNHEYYMGDDVCCISPNPNIGDIRILDTLDAIWAYSMSNKKFEEIHGMLTETNIPNILLVIGNIFKSSNMIKGLDKVTLRNMLLSRVNIITEASLSGSGDINDTTSRLVTLGYTMTDDIEYYVKHYDQDENLCQVALTDDIDHFTGCIRTVLNDILEYYKKVTSNTPLLEITFFTDMVTEDERSKFNERLNEIKNDIDQNSTL